MEAKHRYIALVLMLASLKSTSGFDDGSPAWMCPVGLPLHGNNEPQTGTPPASITLSASSYNPGDSITVTLTGNMEGYVIRAHRAPGANDTEEIVGEFTSWPSGSKPLAWMPQTGVTYNCITHSEEGDYTSLIFTWKAPSTSVGDVIFKAAVVTDFEEFWDNVFSSVLTASTAEPGTTYASQINSDFADYNFADSCGTTKGCLMYPTGCKASSCEVVVAYTSVNNQAAVKFEMFAVLNTGYVSLGFSSDKEMGEELTVNCMRSGDTLYAQHSYNRPDYNIRQRITDLTDIHIKSYNGRLYCSFTRDLSLTYIVGGTATSRTSDLNNQVYLFVATGNVYTDRDTIKKHTVLPIVSKGKLSVLDTKISSGITTPAALGSHVTFGVFGYFILSGFAMLVSRHFRREMNKSVCGNALWFQMHRGTMFCVLVFGIIAIILAIITIEGWNLNVIATVHGIFGLVTTALMLANVIMGMARPVKGRGRKMFSLAHRICGVLTFVFTIVCLLLGSNVDLLHPEIQLDSAILIAVGFIVQIILEIVLEVKRRSPVKGDSETADDKANKRSSETIKIVILAIYGVVMLAITVGIMYLVFTY